MSKISLFLYYQTSDCSIVVGNFNWKNFSLSLSLSRAGCRVKFVFQTTYDESWEQIATEIRQLNGRHYFQCTRPAQASAS